MSRSVRASWIEIACRCDCKNQVASRSVRASWIEIKFLLLPPLPPPVEVREGLVD